MNGHVLALLAGVPVGYLLMEIRGAIRDERRWRQAVVAEARWIGRINPELARRFVAVAIRQRSR